MNLYQIVSYLKQIALSSPYIRTAEEGSVYTIMNGNPHSKYSVFVVSQTQHRQDEIFDYYGLNLFVIDRLVDDLESNRLQTQSLAKEVLTNTILTLESKFYGITHNELQFHPFTEKFVDLTAGQYVQVTFQVPRNLICPDDYGLDFPSNYKLLPLNVEITDNGVYEYSPVADFDGYDSVTLTINVPQSGYTQEDLDNAYESGITSGETYQKSLLESINITENGEYTSTNGYSAVTVNVPQSAYTSGYTQEDLDNAYASGETHQKSLLQDIEITHNGEYQVENGFDKVTVNVPQDSGQTIYNQTKNIEYSGNGEYTVTYDEGYTGLEGVNITVNVPQSAYTSGYTQEDLDEAYASGITSGETYQKSLLSAITITENGEYTSTNGYSAITVDVDTDIWYQSGYTDGYQDAYEELTSLLVIPDSLYYTSGASEQTLAIIAKGAWTIQSKPNWVTLSSNSGSGNKSITVSVPDNNGVIRSGNIVVTSGAKTVTVPVVQDKKTTSDYTTHYLTFNIRSGGTISWKNFKYNDSTDRIISYNHNNSGWNTIHSITSAATTITVAAGDTLKFKGDNTTYKDSGVGYGNSYVHFVNSSGCVFSVYGNMMSLIDSVNFESLTTLSDIGNFSHLFEECDGLLTAQNLKLPATGLTENCYRDLFYGCSRMIQAPTLSATTLALRCYEGMFRGCTSLATAPALPATTLANYCYEYMFLACTSLTSAPILAALTLKEGCYWGMFDRCTSLNNIKCLATNISATDCTNNWVDGVAASGTFTKKSGVNWSTGSSGIPNGWTVIEE